MSEPQKCPECNGETFYLKSYMIGSTKRTWKCRECDNEWSTEHNRTVKELKTWLKQFPENLTVGVYEGEVSCITLHEDLNNFSFFTHERAPVHISYPRVWVDPEDDAYNTSDRTIIGEDE